MVNNEKRLTHILQFLKKYKIPIVIAIIAIVSGFVLLKLKRKGQETYEKYYREAMSNGKCHTGWTPDGKTKDGKKRCSRSKDKGSVWDGRDWRKDLSEPCKTLRGNLHRGLKNGKFSVTMLKENWDGYDSFWKENVATCCFEKYKNGLFCDGSEQPASAPETEPSEPKECNALPWGADNQTRRTLYTTRVSIDGSWTCPRGYTDTSCSWGDGSNEKKQCAKLQTRTCRKRSSRGRGAPGCKPWSDA
jgi:hypothetical protein